MVTGKDQETNAAAFQKLNVKRQSSPIFLFTGQAAQWPGMGRGLIAAFPKFKTTVDKLNQVLKSLQNAPPWSLKGMSVAGHINTLLTKAEILTTDDTSLLDQANISQSACTALQIGLVDLLSEWGIHQQR